MTDTAPRRAPAAPALALPLGLFALAILYGGMTCIAGVLGSKQVGLGTLPGSARSRSRRASSPSCCSSSLSSAVAELYGRATADRLVRFGFVPLITAIALTFIVIQLPTDAGMYEPAKEAFPIILGQSGRLMAAGIIAYGVSMSLNVFIFSQAVARLGASWSRCAPRSPRCSARSSTR